MRRERRKEGGAAYRDLGCTTCGIPRDKKSQVPKSGSHNPHGGGRGSLFMRRRQVVVPIRGRQVVWKLTLRNRLLLLLFPFFPRVSRVFLSIRNKRALSLRVDPRRASYGINLGALDKWGPPNGACLRGVLREHATRSLFVRRRTTRPDCLLCNPRILAPMRFS